MSTCRVWVCDEQVPRAWAWTLRVVPLAFISSLAIKCEGTCGAQETTTATHTCCSPYRTIRSRIRRAAVGTAPAQSARSLHGHPGANGMASIPRAVRSHSTHTSESFKKCSFCRALECPEERQGSMEGGRCPRAEVRCRDSYSVVDTNALYAG